MPRLKIKYRSSLEEKIGEQLQKEKYNFEYEPIRIPYTLPETEHNYLPDFRLEARFSEDPIYIECKGPHRWGGLDKDTRTKMLRVRDCNPGIDIRFIFEKPNLKLGKGKRSKTWEKWAEENDFKYAIGKIPDEWLKEMI